MYYPVLPSLDICLFLEMYKCRNYLLFLFKSSAMYRIFYDPGSPRSPRCLDPLKWRYSISCTKCQFLGLETDTYCHFMGPETDTSCQFLDPENLKMSQSLFKLIFLVAIELIHNPEHVQIVFSFVYWPEFPETDP